MTYYLGVDIGTGSARAGVFDGSGVLLGSASRPIAVLRPAEDFVEQSSRDIWEAVCDCVRRACAAAAIDGASVAGIGFDATCSLVVVDGDGGPVTVSPTGDDDWNVVVWMDHRAIGDAEAINALSGTPSGKVLDYVGGVISPEMEMPKLRWLKRELPGSWKRAAAFFDLPDWLVFRATGSDTRSLCSTVCKWTYLGHRGTSGEGWNRDFLEAIGLGELAEGGFAALGNRFAAPGDRVGTLSAKAACELGLHEGVAVAASLIDAYSGALGTLGVSMGTGSTNADPAQGGSASAGSNAVGAAADLPAGTPAGTPADLPAETPLDHRLALIAGTSSCHIAVSREAAFVPGVWGPYYSVLLPGLWANEAGQSAAGALIDRIIDGHAACAEARRLAADDGISLFALLDRRLEVLAAHDGCDATLLTVGRHIQPDFHGNRSPLADPKRKGAIVGLSLDRGVDDLALDYLATLQALAYGTRHIIEVMRERGVTISALVVSGGLAQNRLFLRQHADACGCTIVVPDQAEPVLAGSAMLAAVAAGSHATLPEAMAAMSGKGTVIVPRSDVLGNKASGCDIASYHDRKYRVFRRMQQDFAAYAELMAG